MENSMNERINSTIKEIKENERINSVIEEIKKSADRIYLDIPIKLSRHNLPPVIGPQEKNLKRSVEED